MGLWLFGSGFLWSWAFQPFGIYGSLGSGFLGLRIFQSSVPKVLGSFGSGILGLRNFQSSVP